MTPPAPRTARGVVAALILFASAAHGVDEAPSEIRMGETLEIALTLPAAGAWRIGIGQRDIDVVVTLESPGEGDPLTVNNPLPFHRYDALLVESASAVDVTLRLRAASGAARGTVAVSFDRVDGARREALAALTEAARLAHEHENDLTARHLAVPHYKTAASRFEAAGAGGDRARALASLAAVLLRVERTRESLPVFREALGAGLDDYDACIVHTDLGYAHMELHESDPAMAAFTRALALATGAEDRRLEALSVFNIGLVHLGRNRFDDALASFRRARSTYRDAGDIAGEAMTVSSSAVANLAQGDPDQAIENTQRALALYEAAGDRQNYAAVLNNLGSIHLKTGEFDRALLSYRSAAET